MSSEVALRVPFLTCKDIPDGALIQIAFQFPALEHPVYGKVDGIHGYVPLLLPQGSFPESNFYRMTKSEQDEILDHYVRDYRTLHEELDDDQIRSRYRDYLLTTALIDPKTDIRSQSASSVREFYATIFQMDDLADDDSVMLELDFTTANIYRRYSLWEKVFEGDYATFRKLGLQFPILKTGFNGLANASAKIIPILPGGAPSLRFMYRGLFESSESVPLVTLDLLRQGKQKLSEEGYKVPIGINAGFQMPVEYLASLRGIEISDMIRSSLLFEIFMNGFNLLSRLFNDVFGLQKDLKKPLANDNRILRRIVEAGLTLEESFQETINLLRNTVHDTRLAGKKLIETFPNEPQLAEYVRIAEYVCDGQAYAYFLLFHIKGRYGSIDVSIVPQT